MSTLDALPVGSAAVIEALRAGRSLTVRLASLGLVPGERVRVLVNYGTGPVVVAVRGGRVAVGRGQARRILVRPAPEGVDVV